MTPPEQRDPRETQTDPPTPPAATEPSRLLLRFSGDLTTKGDATRRRMTSRLVENLRASIKASGRTGRVLRDRNRVFVELAPLPPPLTDEQDEPVAAPPGPGAGPDATPAPATPAAPIPDDDEMAERLGRVFGVQSVSVTERVRWSTLEDVVRAGERFGAEPVKDRRFAIRARRVGDRHKTKLRSAEVERELGEVLRPLASRVDLTNPEVRIFVEIDPEYAYFFVAKHRGAGGLPLGTEGRAVSLISGGFDSPVASWRLLRRGIALDYVFCNLGGRPHELETLRIAKLLADRWQSGTRPRFHSVDFDPVSREIQAKVTMRYWQVILKRMMLRAAEAVAESWEASAIVTGEAIGQVSSQTLQNLTVIEHGARWPVLRPLVGNNKDEIIAESKIVGTHDLSAKVGEYCAIVPSRPATHAKLADILAEEAKLDPSVLAQAIESRIHFNLAEIDLEAWNAADLSTSELTSEDVVIDLRAKAAYTAWHYPNALFLDFPNALRAYASFDPNQSYVLYCEFGLKSAHLADLMRRAGLRATHISGGLREAQRIAEQKR